MAWIPVKAVLSRAVRLRCPRCGEGKLFMRWFHMHETCSDCKLRYEQAPGYFLGSAYINYGVTALIVTIAYVSLHFGASISNRSLVGPLLAFIVLCPLACFRHARSVWIAMDCFFDRTSFEQDPE
jgi:uncharacterized protein (DUF983 family)